jgi:hypothetical protein
LNRLESLSRANTLAYYKKIATYGRKKFNNIALRILPEEEPEKESKLTCPEATTRYQSYFIFTVVIYNCSK